MPSVEVPVPFPFGGVSDNLSYTAQPQGTTRAARNMRGIDPVTGRVRGAQRSGLSRFVDAQVSGENHVRNITQVVFNNKSVTYAEASSTPGDGGETVTWQTATPTAEDCKNGVVDRAGNVYALNGNSSLVKYNSDGVKQWVFSFPVAHPDHEIRALKIDDFDNLYVGVSDGGDAFDEETEEPLGRIWRYRQPSLETEAEIVLDWEVEVDAYCENFELSEGLLYCALNRPRENLSEIRVLSNLDSGFPLVSKFKKTAASPINDIAVGPDGSVYLACQANENRAIHPTDPDSDPVLVDWTPNDLTDADERIWGWWNAKDLGKNFSDGEGLKFWGSRKGKGRTWYYHEGETSPYTTVTDNNGGTEVTIRRPKYRELVQAGQPGVSFNGIDEGMLTAPNTSVEAKAVQRSAVPAYNGAGYAIFIVAKVAPDDADRRYCMISQPFPTTFSAIDQRFIATNRRNLDTLPGSVGGSTDARQWVVSAWDDSNNAHGDNGQQPASFDGDFHSAAGSTTAETPNIVATTNNPNGIAIICHIVEGGTTGDEPFGGTATSNGDTDDDVTHSVWRFNGRTFDRYHGSGRIVSERRTTLGYDRDLMHLSVELGDGSFAAGEFDFFKGEILEILVIDRKAGTWAADSILTHPFVYDSQDVNTTPPYQAYAGSSDDTTGYSEVEQIEGYLAWAWGASSVLTGQNAGPDAHTFDLQGGPPSKETGQDDSTLYTQLENADMLIKFDQNLKAKWKLSATDPASNDGGVGYGVTVDSSGNVYSMGPSNVGTGSVTVRKVIDEGSTYSIDSADGAWDLEITRGGDTFDLTYAYPRMVTDEFDNLYIPLHDTDVSGANRLSFMVVARDADPIDTNNPDILNEYVLADDQQAHAIAIESVAADTDIDKHRYVYVFTTNEGDSTIETVHKVELISASVSSGSVRTITNVAVSNGNLKTFTSSTVNTPTGGSAAFDASAPTVFSAVMFGRVYYTDGLNYKKYDPKANEVTTLVASANGKIPPACSLIATWRGRLVLARSSDAEDGGHFWAMSAIGDPTNWDFFPKVASSAQAVAGTVALTGRPIDIINTLVPYNDDLLLFGCDHHIFRLSGDPADGGQVDLVSDVTGMAYGKPWAKSPEGILFFAGSNGSIYAMSPYASSEIRRISRDSIERRLQDKDLADYRFELVWNQREEGLHVFLVPLAASGGTLVEHYFWEQKTGSWWEDRFGATGVQPTCAAILDGDEEDDRVVVLGCEDGRIRTWDEDAATDDTNNIDSFVTFGPLSPSGAGADPMREYKWDALQVTLASDQGGCEYELFGFAEPDPHENESGEIVDALGTPLISGRLVGGFNSKVYNRIRGRYAYLRLRNASASRWAMETASIAAAPAGRVRR